MDIKDNEENGSDAQKTLDMEFRKILRVIKPYIPCIMNNQYLTFYRLWLEKLSETNPAEKQERNRYLVELCDQIQDGILEYPFTDLPAEGPLPPFNNVLNSKVQSVIPNVPALLQRNPESTLMNITNRPQSPEIETEQDTVNNYFKNQPLQQKSLRVLKSPVPMEQSNKLQKRRNLHTLSKINQKYKAAPQKLSLNDYSLQLREPNLNFQQEQMSFKDVLKNQEPFFVKVGHYLHEQQFQANDYPCLMQNAPQLSTLMPSDLNRKTYVQENIINVGVEVEDDGDETSWYDVSDASTTTLETKLASGDSDRLPTPPNNKVTNMDRTYEMYEQKIVDLMGTISELQKRNLMINEDVVKYEQNFSLSMNCLLIKMKKDQF